MVEGIHIGGFQTFGLTLDYGSFLEAWITNASFSAEASGPGTHVQFITKSGGNQYHGTFYGDVEPPRWQARNITSSQLERADKGRGGPVLPEDNQLVAYHDLNADISGYVWRDRSWWYASVRQQEVATRVVTFSDPQRMRFDNVSAKSTTRLGAGSQLVVFGGLTRTAQPTRLDAFFITAPPWHSSADSTSDHRATGSFGKIEWRSTIGQRHFVEARGAWFGADRRDRPRSTDPRYEDSSSMAVTGGTRDWREEMTRPQLLLTATSFLKGRAGEHQLKIGGEIFRFFTRETWFTAFGNGVLHVLQNSTPVGVRRFLTPSRSEAGMWWYAAFASDVWRISDAVSATIGARFDRFRLFLPAQAPPPFTNGPPIFPAVNNLIDWNIVSPRLGVVARVTPDGRTLAKVTYASYPGVPGTDLGFNASENANVWWIDYEWKDDGDRVWSPGEEGLALRQRGGQALESIDPNLRLQRTYEVAAWLERELPRAVLARSGIVWRGDRDLYSRQDTSRPFAGYTVPSIIQDPGPDSVMQTGDEGAPVTVYQSSSTAPPGRNEVRNVPGAATNFLTWEASAVRRHGGRWALLGGVSYTWNRDHASAYFGQAVRQNMLPLTPNDLLHTDARGRHVFTTWTARLQLTYEIFRGLRATAFVRHQSGQPYGRTLFVGFADTRVVLTEPIGTRRMDHLTVADLRIEKTFGLAPARVSIFGDVFNVLNANPEQNVSWLSGTGQSFQRPITIVPPRIARVGVRVMW